MNYNPAFQRKLNKHLPLENRLEYCKIHLKCLKTGLPCNKHLEFDLITAIEIYLELLLCAKSRPLFCLVL